MFTAPPPFMDTEKGRRDRMEDDEWIRAFPIERGRSAIICGELRPIHSG